MGPPIEMPIREEAYRRALEAMALERVDGVIVSDSADNFRYRLLKFPPGEEGERLKALFDRCVQGRNRINESTRSR